MSQKQSTHFSKILVTFTWILIALLLIASGCLLWISNRTAGGLRLGGQTLYLTDEYATGAEDKSNCLLFVSDRKPKIGDLILLQLEDQDGNLFYSVSSVRSLDSSELLVYDGLLKREFSLHSEDILGVVTASNQPIGALLQALSTPEERIPILIGMGCVFLLIFSALTAALFFSERKQSSVGDDLSKDSEQLYEVILEPKSETQQNSSSLQLNAVIEHENEPLILETPPEYSAQQISSEDPIKKIPTQMESTSSEIVPEVFPSIDFSKSNVTLVDETQSTIAEKEAEPSVYYLEHIDSDPVDITMTNEELEALKNEILNMQIS